MLRQNLPTADFREGQWEAIESLVEGRKRVLIVQRTGWGKSVVYFLSTRLLRLAGQGPALLVSPLLALMRNQIEAAYRLGVEALTINSTNKEDWETIQKRLAEDSVDVLLVSPERLANADFLEKYLKPLAGRVSMLIIDEAHCISDWGHDFRVDYRRIRQVLQLLCADAPVCATTATANDRVVADVVGQLGEDVAVSRGPLVRESLKLQTVPLPDDMHKLAWLIRWVPKFKGSGIVYALTVRWVDCIAEWLQKNQINALPYHADLDDAVRQDREQLLLTNQIKVLVATTALGMGYDKPDVGFVVHFHQPASVVAYYQQVGRAGRALPEAHGVMLTSNADQIINDYFIENAFPPERSIEQLLAALSEHPEGLKIHELEREVNLATTRIRLALTMLAIEQPPAVENIEGLWRRTAHPYDPQQRAKLAQRMTELRRTEQEQMNQYREHTGCLMRFLTHALDDSDQAPCGRCAPCQNKPEALRASDYQSWVPDAFAFVQSRPLVIEPRRRWPTGYVSKSGEKGKFDAEELIEEGRALCAVTDPGRGETMSRCRREGQRYDDPLVTAMMTMLREWRAPVGMVVGVPSLRRPQLVRELAQRIAEGLKIPYVDALRRTRATKPMSGLHNSWHQAENLDGAFEVTIETKWEYAVLLVDDVVRSRWTMTLAGMALRQAGCPGVFPVALAMQR
jgi:ATP-dependent DNA helicase RecQ